MTTIAVIPDIQAKDGQDFSFLRDVGNFLVEKQPDYWVQLGDFLDFESLSSYDVGKKSFEGRRIVKDINAGYEAMDSLMGPLLEYNHQAKLNKKKQYHPELHITLGNHCDRLSRVINEDPKLDGLIKIADLPFEKYGWQVHPFLEVLQLEGICFSHYFTSGVMGRPVGNAKQLLAKKHMSCVQGHVQKMDICTEYKADGTMLTGLFAGCCYMHDETYLGLQGNNHFRGIHMLYEVNNGEFHTHSVTLKYLKERYANSS